MPIIELQTDILSNIDPDKPTVILHGCNCFNTMGAGVALYLKRCFPAVYEADLKTVRGDKNKLGTFSFAKIRPNLYIVNCYTQYRYGTKPEGDFDLEAIEKALTKVNSSFGYDFEVRSVRIGCGLAGGKWEKVKPIFDKVFSLRDVIIYNK